ncbi:aldehyde ferredoxin oxidoreductase C-terminal domain-containing protein, partial [Chloroflexota bacterium]
EAITTIINEEVRGTSRLESWIAYGTWLLMRGDQMRGSFPTWNFKEGYFEDLADFHEEAFAQEFRVGIHSCFCCPNATHKATKVTDPEFAGCGLGPEYETFASLGPCCGVSNLSAIVRAGHLCNDMGLDSIDTGVTIACAMELFEKGILSEKDTGYKLNFGNAKAMVELVEKIGRRQDFGDILAEGGYRMAEKYGHPELFMGSKKQAMPLHHPQANQGSALAYTTSNHGANHMRVARDPSATLDPFSTAGQASATKDGQDWRSMTDSCGLCCTSRMYGKKEDFPPLLEAVTGVSYTVDDLQLIGERIWNLERLFNLKAGFTAKDDTMPKRMLEEPMTLGAAAGHVCELGVMVPEYYELREWDKDGIPAPEKLEQLGLT